MADRNTIQALLIKVHEEPVQIEVKNYWRSLSQIVGGYIEFFPITVGINVICNESGKVNGMQGNRLIVNEIICGDYTFTEIRTIDRYILSSQRFVITIDTDGNIVSNTAITNSPTALNIFKVTHENNTPLTGAGFYIKNWFGLNKLTFTQDEDGIYRYDKDGDIEEILVNENGEAIVYGLPIGNY